MFERARKTLWTDSDYINSVARSNSGDGQIDEYVSKKTDSLDAQIDRAYRRLPARDDLESPELINDGQTLPPRGAQVHAEYTLYGHFRVIDFLLGHVQKLTCYLDQDAGMKPALFATFKEKIKAGDLDAFYVHIAKGLTIDHRKQNVSDAKRTLDAMLHQHPTLSVLEIRRLMIAERIPKQRRIGPDWWIAHPFPNLGEPEKKVAYLTDRGHHRKDDLIPMFERASLHAVDTFFMSVRRRLANLERPISPARRGRRVWHGNAPYNPEMVEKLLMIFRVWYNFCHTDRGRKETPAMRIGLTKGAIRLEDILYFDPYEAWR